MPLQPGIASTFRRNISTNRHRFSRRTFRAAGLSITGIRSRDAAPVPNAEIKRPAGKSEFTKDTFAFSLNNNLLIFLQISKEYLLGYGIFNIALDHTLQRAGPKQRIKTLLGEQVLSRAGKLYGHMALEQAVVQSPDIKFHDLAYFRLSQLPEDDNIVKAVKELRTELPFKLALHLVFHTLIAGISIPADIEACALRLRYLACAEVRSHNDDRILEPLAVSQVAIIQHLEQRIENIRMRLFDLIKQDH